jgi:hypothetical protein
MAEYESQVAFPDYRGVRSSLKLQHLATNHIQVEITDYNSHVTTIELDEYQALYLMRFLDTALVVHNQPGQEV